MRIYMEKKNTLLLTVIAIATLLVAVVGATFAYFQAQLGSSASASVTVTTQSTDQLTFTAAALVVGPATQANFGPSDTSLSDTKSASVALNASADASATYCYTATLNVTSNNFEYTTAPTNTPELTISASKNSTPVVTNSDITILGTTGQSTSLALGSTHTITAAAGQTATDTWSITVTFVNLATDQSLQGPGEVNNLDKTFQGTVDFTQGACS